MLMLIELIGAFMIICACAYGISKLIEIWYDRIASRVRNTDRKEPE